MPTFRQRLLMLGGVLAVLLVSISISARRAASAAIQDAGSAAQPASVRHSVRGNATPNDPPPLDTVIKYFFTGVTDNANAVTAIHCTNTSDQGFYIWIQLYSENLVDYYEREQILLPGRTYTLTSSEQPFFYEWANLNTSYIQQGVGRIAVDDRFPDKVICTAQVLEKNNPPAFIVSLDMFAPR